MHTGMWIFSVDNDLDGNCSPTNADGAGLGGPNIQWQTDFYRVLIP